MKRLITKFALGAALLSPFALALPAMAAAPSFDVSGAWVIAFDYGGTYSHDMTLAQDGTGAITSGSGGYPAGGPYSYTWVVDSGSVSGNTLSLTAHYTGGPDAVVPLTVMHMTGTIAGDGTMSGTWDDNYQGGARAGTWVSTSGAASPIVVTPACSSDDTTFDTFTLGSVNGQHGWSATGAYDQSIVDNTYGIATFGCKSLRLSNGYADGAFGGQTFAPLLATGAGETSVAPNKRFEAQFDVASVLSTLQAGLAVSVSPDNGSGARMSYLRFEDQADGIHVHFVDVTDVGPLGTVANFNDSDIATITRQPHTIKFVMDFVDGPANDIVKIYIDGSLVKTGTSWEDYYRYDPEQAGGGNLISPVTTLIFAARGSSVPTNLGKGYLFDNVSMSSGAIPPVFVTVSSKDQCMKGGWQNYTDSNGKSFKNQGDCVSFVATKGKNTAK